MLRSTILFPTTCSSVASLRLSNASFSLTRRRRLPPLFSSFLSRHLVSSQQRDNQDEEEVQPTGTINTYNYYSDDISQNNNNKKKSYKRNRTSTTELNVVRTPFWMDPQEPAEEDTNLPTAADNSEPSSLKASELLLWYLRNDSSWRDETLTLIDLPQNLNQTLYAHLETSAGGWQPDTNNNINNNNNSNSNKVKSTTPNEARNPHDTFFYNWLDPFYQRLVHDQELRNELQPSLDALIQVGLGAPATIDKYWDRELYQPPLQKRLEEHEQNLQQLLQDRVPSLQKELQELQTQSQAVAKELQQLHRDYQIHQKTRSSRQPQHQPPNKIDIETNSTTTTAKTTGKDDPETSLSFWERFQNLFPFSWPTTTDSESKAVKKSKNTTTTILPPMPPMVDVDEVEISKATAQKFFSSFKRNRKRLESQQRRLGRQVKTCQSQLESTETSKKRMNRYIKRTKRELKQLDHGGMSLEEYQHASAAVKHVKTDVCRVLANYVRSVHEHLLIHYKNLGDKADLSQPHTWFQETRAQKRRIIFHGGPTSSGKTYEALQRLSQAKRGMYFGPLRLLAAEVYDKLSDMGIRCNLYTGQEKRTVENATHGAATIEMAKNIQSVDPNHPVDVVVIDEIQMIADLERGYAWTRALLGTGAAEIHVCGGMEAVDLVRKLVDTCGDEMELRTYERFSPLEVEEESLTETSGSQWKSYADTIQPGDCVVCFSRKDIFALQREIEQGTGQSCCIIYGSLPPETRAKQAKLFNDPNSGYDILVASDAIGMGLNLSIKRIIFHTLYKYDGAGIVRLTQSDVKQIAGRAGRKMSPYPDGLVTCRDPGDLSYIKHAVEQNISPIRKAGIMPHEDQLETFHSVLEKSGLVSDSSPNNLHTTLMYFSEMASVEGDCYFLGRGGSLLEIAKLLAPIDLPIRQKYRMCLGPINLGDQKVLVALMRFARSIASGEPLRLKSDKLKPTPAESFDDMTYLCSIVGEVDLFLWLHERFPPGASEQDVALAREIRQEAVDYINEALIDSDSLTLDHDYVQSDYRLRERFYKRSQVQRSPK